MSAEILYSAINGAWAAATLAALLRYRNPISGLNSTRLSDRLAKYASQARNTPTHFEYSEWRSAWEGSVNQ